MDHGTLQKGELLEREPIFCSFGQVERTLKKSGLGYRVQEKPKP